MPIRGLEYNPAQTQHQTAFRSGSPDVAEAAGVTLQAYGELGYHVKDKDQAEASLDGEFSELAALDYDGRLFVPVPEEVSFSHILDVAEKRRLDIDNVDSVYRYHPLWTPGTEADSYTEGELNRGPVALAARLAVFDVQDTGVDPVLHYVDMPLDDYAQREWGGETTQLNEFETVKQTIEADDSSLEILTLDHRDFALLALMDRIRGVKPAKQILAQGFMRLPNLLRRTVAGVSLVGGVYSRYGRLDLSVSGGRASPHEGLGVSVGQKQLGL